MLWMFWLGAVMILTGAFGLTLGLVSYAHSAVVAYTRRYPTVEQVLYGRC